MFVCCLECDPWEVTNVLDNGLLPVRLQAVFSGHDDQFRTYLYETCGRLVISLGLQSGSPRPMK